MTKGMGCVVYAANKIYTICVFYIINFYSYFYLFAVKI